MGTPLGRPAGFASAARHETLPVIPPGRLPVDRAVSKVIDHGCSRQLGLGPSACSFERRGGFHMLESERKVHLTQPRGHNYDSASGRSSSQGTESSVLVPREASPCEGRSIPHASRSFRRTSLSSQPTPLRAMESVAACAFASRSCESVLSSKSRTSCAYCAASERRGLLPATNPRSTP